MSSLGMFFLGVSITALGGIIGHKTTQSLKGFVIGQTIGATIAAIILAIIIVSGEY